MSCLFSHIIVIDKGSYSQFQRKKKCSIKNKPICIVCLVAQMVKNSPAMRETWIRSLGWEDPLEEGMSTRSSILAWRIPMDREAWWATVPWVAKSQT